MASNFAFNAFALWGLTFETGNGEDSLAFAMFSNFFASSLALLIARASAGELRLRHACAHEVTTSPQRFVR